LLNNIPDYDNKDLEKINSIINKYGFASYDNSLKYLEGLEFLKNIWQGDDTENKSEIEIQLETEYNELKNRKLIGFKYDENRYKELEIKLGV
jgi:hypothetical protein